MSIFGSIKKKVTNEEFKKVRTILYSKGFTSKELDEVEKIFHGDLNEPSEDERGIDDEEIERGVEWMRKNKNNHFISDRKIEILESVLKSKL